VYSRSVYVAHKTMAAIDAAIEADQGEKYRYWLGRVLPHIGDIYRQGESRFRGHLGASVLGIECGRAIWYSFRWFSWKAFGGRMLRLFNRGHMEEARFIACLLTIGMDIRQQDEHGRQFKISFAGGHGGGSGDGYALGCPDLDVGVSCLLEFKTHNEKSFEGVKGEGVRVSKFEHFVQANTYMHKMGFSCCLYGAVNKNTDEIYMELLMYDKELAEKMIDRGETIVFMKEPPKKISESLGFFKCKFCDHFGVCKMGHEPELNCRTCANSEPLQSGDWVCKLHGITLTEESQLAGCSNHRKLA
jgi:hypothetical protein